MARSARSNAAAAWTRTSQRPASARMRPAAARTWCSSARSTGWSPFWSRTRTVWPDWPRADTMLAPMAPAPPVTTATRVIRGLSRLCGSLASGVVPPRRRFRAGVVCPRRRFRAGVPAEDHRVGQPAAVLDQVPPDQADRPGRVEPGDRLAIRPQHPGPVVVAGAAGRPGDARPGLDGVQPAGVQRDQGVRGPAEPPRRGPPGPRRCTRCQRSGQDRGLDAHLRGQFRGAVRALRSSPGLSPRRCRGSTCSRWACRAGRSAGQPAGSPRRTPPSWAGAAGWGCGAGRTAGRGAGRAPRSRSRRRTGGRRRR